MARSVHCKCEHNFTCGYCFSNMKPYLYTPSSSRFYFSRCVMKDNERDELIKIKQKLMDNKNT